MQTLQGSKACSISKKQGDNGFYLFIYKEHKVIYMQISEFFENSEILLKVRR